MSVVINAILGGRSYLMCDGRARNAETGLIVSENQQKIIQISPTVAVGFTGTLEHARYLLDKVPVSSKEFCDSYTQKLSRIAVNELTAKPKATFLVTGISGSGLLESYTLGEYTQYIASKTSQLTSIGDTEKLDFIQFFNIRFGQTYGSLEHRILHVMEKYIERLAAKTESVNTNTSKIVIAR